VTLHLWLATLILEVSVLFLASQAYLQNDTVLKYMQASKTPLRWR
jgi:hypothetical protein